MEQLNKANNHNTPLPLKTRWTDEVDSENVLCEYPRPQMVRDNWKNLNGLWNYAIRPIDEPVKEFDGEILVPFPLESYLSGVQKSLLPNELLWYQTSFNIDQELQGKKVLIHFGAVDWKMTLWINDKKVGEHVGGYSSFYFDITNEIVIGENNIKISVWDPTDSENEQRGKQTLNPGGIFYTAISGIWQTVWLEFVPEKYMTSIKLTPNIDQETVTISVTTNVKNNELTFEAEIFEKEKLIVSGDSLASDALTLSIPKPKLWSPENPFLYDVKIKLFSSEMVDSIDSYFGMRKFSIERDQTCKKRLFVNNEVYFQHGILDQGYWPDGLYTAPTDAALEYDIVTTKELGFNMIRKHIKVEPARWYYHCDRHGMIVWQDMINGGSGWKNLYHFILPNFFRKIRVDDTKETVQKALGRNDEKNRQQFKKELRKMIDQLYNVPSIAMWVPFNEGWGQFNAKEIYEWLRRYDPTRYTMHTSGWYDQQVGDIRSIHIYFRKLKMPNNILDRTVVISEYGGYKLRLYQQYFNDKKLIGYKEYKSKGELLGAYQKLIEEQLKPLISQGLSAAVYTQLTDVEEEVNGFITYNREQIKLNKHTLQKINEDLIDEANIIDN